LQEEVRGQEADNTWKSIKSARGPPKGEKAFLENEDHHLVLDQRGAKRCEWRGCRNPQ